MKHIYKIQNLDCAACALKLEDKIKKVGGVNNCSINFIMQKMTIDFSDNNTLDEVKKVCDKFEDGVKITRIG